MARRLSESEAKLAQPSFTSVDKTDTIFLNYHCELITPMAGGGTRSWQPDLNNPVRSQAIKGQLRFWWRTMSKFSDSEALKKRENEIWGSTDTAGKIRLRVESVSKPTAADLIDIEKNDKDTLQFPEADLPGYVLFPLQGHKDLPNYRLIKRLTFKVTISVFDSSLKAEIENSVKLWLLFGGLGARTRRGCGSLYCPEVMKEFQNEKELGSFVKKLARDSSYGLHESPFPILGNCTLATRVSPEKSNPASEWRSFLDSYGMFRQGRGVGRNQGQGNRPGRTRWPEADAIRRITGDASSLHNSVHPAGNWFPRGAFGMPILSKFKNTPKEPTGTFYLQPEGKERWPSPVFLKVIKLNNTSTLRVCLILNHAIPQSELTGDHLNKPHLLTEQEAPMCYEGKTMPAEANMLHSGENPYAALIRHLRLKEVL